MTLDEISEAQAIDRRALRAAAAPHFPAMIGFAQRLIQTPSLPGEEEDVARILADGLKRLAYDDVWIDRVGNVLGVIRGVAGGSSVQFNAHLDHVAVGDPALWPLPPFAAEIRDDVLYGRGASDVKGATAPQLYLWPVLRDAGLRPAGDVYVVGVVLEEVGGFGSQVLAQETPTTYAVLAEATNNQLRRGHRGRVYMKVSFTGLSAHASAPDRARNPHFALARFLLALERLEMVRDATFGGSTVAPTLIGSDQTSGNVTPATVAVNLDWRNVPSESVEAILARLRPLVEAAADACPEITGAIEVVGRDVKSYTGPTATMPPTRGFETAADDPLVTTAHDALVAALDRPVEIGTWTFATDGGHLAHHGVKTIGFAPGEERFAHTIHDQISIPKMKEALIGNAALALALTREGGR